jgi:hypothetical protein
MPAMVSMDAAAAKSRVCSKKIRPDEQNDEIDAEFNQPVRSDGGGCILGDRIVPADQHAHLKRLPAELRARGEVADRIGPDAIGGQYLNADIGPTAAEGSASTASSWPK